MKSRGRSACTREALGRVDGLETSWGHSGRTQANQERIPNQKPGPAKGPTRLPNQK
jgi:hypothetical protein